MLYTCYTIDCKYNLNYEEMCILSVGTTKWCPLSSGTLFDWNVHLIVTIEHK